MNLFQYLSALSRYDWCLILLMIIVLRLFYKSIRVEWPESYFEPVRSLEFFVSRNAFGFLAFRILPTTLVLTIFGAFSVNPQTVVLVSGVLYLFYSILLTIARIRSDREIGLVSGKNRIKALAVTSIFVLASILFAHALVLGATKYLPHPSEVLGDMVAGAIASILTLSYVAVTRREPQLWDVKPRTKKSVEAIETEIIGIALECSVDPVLALSIANVEDTQRPKWFRRLENSTDFLRKTGTYGLFQVRTSKKITDLESCRKAMERLAGTFPELTDNFAINWQVERAAELHNPDVKFARYVAEVYRAEIKGPFAESKKKAHDGRSRIEVWQFVRFAEILKLRGTVWNSLGSNLVVRQLDFAGNLVLETRIDSTGNAHRAGWSIKVGEGARIVEFRLVQDSSEKRRPEKIHIHLGKIQADRDTTLRNSPDHLKIGRI